MTDFPETSRRSAIRYLCASAAAGCLPAAFGERAPKTAKFPIGACDWTIGQKQHIDAFEVAEKIGLEGLQVSFSTPGSDFDLRDKKVREQYYKRVDVTGAQIGCVAVS